MKKINFYIGLITIVLIIVTTITIMQKNDIKNTVIDQKEQIEQLEKENYNLQNLDEEKEGNTFEEDIEWLVEQIYTIENRKKLYEEIEDLSSKEVLTELFGEELPPEENQGEVESIDREANNIKVYGKYEDESHYKSIVTFDLSMKFDDKEDDAFTVLQVDLIKHKDKWIVDNFEEYAKGGRE